MNKQEIFNKVAQHLLSQNQKAMKDDKCCYRNDDGLTCAVGCLIPESRYSEEIEGKVANELQDSYFRGIFDVSNIEIWNLLDDLQIVHDNVYVQNWKTALRQVAEGYNLEWNF